MLRSISILTKSSIESNSSNIIKISLKLGNLFQSEKMELKLGDFGLAAKLEFITEKRHTVCGTPNYIAPEIQENKSGHSYEADLWSLGVILYTMLVGKPPFETPDVKSTYKKIKMGSYSFPEHVPLSDNSKNIISKLLSLDPTKRPNLDEIVSSPFIANGDNIPRTLPLSSLACPPSGTYTKQFLKRKDSQRLNPKSQVSDIQQLSIKNNTVPSKSDFNFGSGKNILPINDGAVSNMKINTSGEIYIKKWVEYSSKYGLGYLQSNGSAGVFFNDCTKIILDFKKE